MKLLVNCTARLLRLSRQYFQSHFVAENFDDEMTALTRSLIFWCKNRVFKSVALFVTILERIQLWLEIFGSISLSAKKQSRVILYIESLKYEFCTLSSQ